MVFWNTLEIPDPPTQLCSVSTSVFRKSDLLKIEETISSAILTLKSLSQLHLEAAVLSRIMYKQKSRFRNDKGFKKLEKVNRGLLKYLAFDIARIYKKFHTLLPVCLEGFEFCLPSRQLLQWVLVCTQGFAKLFCVIADTCEESACFWKGNIKNGNLGNMSIMLMGVLGRIWSYAKFLVQSTCNWFSQLRPYCNILPLKGIAWLPKDYEIPEDLKTWLKSPHITNSTEDKSLQEKTSQKRIFDLIAPEDDDLVDCGTLYISNEEVPHKKMKKENNLLLSMPNANSTRTKNHGEVTARSTIKTNKIIPAFAHAMSVKDFGVIVPRRPKNKSSKKEKKQLRDNSLNNFDKSSIDPNSDLSNNAECAQELFSSSVIWDKKQEKKRKRKLKSMEHFQPNNFETTDNNTQSMKKKQLLDNSLNNFDKSPIDPNSDLGNIAKCAQDLFSSNAIHDKKLQKKRKDRKRKLKSMELVQPNSFETTDNDNTQRINRTQNETSRKLCEVQKFSLAQSIDKHLTNENGPEKDTLTISKRKRKKKSKLDRQHSLVYALSKDAGSGKTTSSNKHFKGGNNQISKQSKKKKGKK